MEVPPQPLRVLVVDDSADTVDSCAELLGLYGHEVRTALRADEALALLDGWGPDVALLDLAMPDMDGCELARRIRERGEGRPLLVAVTGMTASAERERAGAAGFDHLLLKPVNPDVLTDLLRDRAASLAKRAPR